LKTTLEEWSAGEDPDGLSWKYLPGVTDKRGLANYYVPVDWTEEEQQQPGKQNQAA